MPQLYDYRDLAPKPVPGRPWNSGLAGGSRGRRRTWEEQDGLQVPQIDTQSEMQAEPPESPSGPVAPSNPFGTELKGALDRKVAHAKAAPRADAAEYEPGTGRKVLAGIGAGLAGLAGYVNAGGRTRVDPSGGSDLADAAMHGKYNRAMRSWEEEGKGIDTELGATQKTFDLEQERLQGESAFRRANAAERTATANEKRLALTQEQRLAPKPQALMNLGEQGVFDPERRELVPGTQRPTRPPAPVPGRDVPFGPDVETQRTRMSIASRVPRDDNPTQVQLAAIENRYQERLIGAEEDHRRRMVGPNGIDEATSLSQLEDMKRVIRSSYLNEKRAMGAGTQAPAAPAPPPNPYRPPQAQ